MNQARRICILADGKLDIFTAKTALGLLRYCPDEVVAVLDREHAGENLKSLVGCGDGIPIVDNIASVASLSPTHLAIGVALPGGVLPESYRAFVLEALEAGMDILNGLHTRLAEDADLARVAASNGRTIHDLRVPPATTQIGNGLARSTRATRVLTVGTDCNLGKKITALELVRGLNARGKHAEFIPTGQTGVLIAGWGAAIDGVVCDFLSGVVEQSVLAKGDSDFVIVEGQGSILHPSYSGVTMGLMHGSLPDWFVVCHAPSRQFMRHTDVPVAHPNEMIALTESLLQPIHPARCAGISLNCHGMSDADADAALTRIADETGLPVVDSIRTGVEPLVDALMSERD
jgi:uncharacterized NAD-dependent epimerase/dehydratase family protein